MQRTSRSKYRAAYSPLPGAAKGLAGIFVAFMALRVISSVGADAATEKYVAGMVSDGHVACQILNFELGHPSKDGTSLAQKIVGMVFPGEAEAPDEAVIGPDAAASADTSSPAAGAADSQEPAAGTAGVDLGLFYDADKLAGAGEVNIPTVITKPAAETSTQAIALNNKAGVSVNTAALLKEPLSIKLSSDGPAVLIIHTHSSEAYLPDKDDPYTPSDPFRTQDKSHSVVRVGDEIASVLKEHGISVIHDTGTYDYPSYQGSYNRSYDAIQSYLKKYPSIKIVIDLHRDAIEAADGSVYKTIAQVDGSTCSQVMFVMGTDAAGLKHPKWKENFKLALHLQQEMNKLYPSLAKPIELSQYRYNQQATKGSMILEVGTTGNTLQESVTAARYFAEAAANVLAGLKE